MPLSARVYECENCGLSIDRDLNASKNLEKYGSTDSLSGSKACGESNRFDEARSEHPSHEEWGFARYE